MDPSRVMQARDLRRCIARLAHEISERMGPPDTYALAGIITGGATLCRLLADAIEGIEGSRPLAGSLDITLYRDDLYTGLEKPVLGVTDLPFDLGERHLVLVDDVLFTGRTVRAALDEVMDYGRPRSIKLAVLVDRGHRELPVAPDFVGRTIPTSKSDQVTVHLGDTDAGEGVFVHHVVQGSVP